MTDEIEIPPWERLQRLSEMSAHIRDVYAKRWANELMSRHGIGAMPRYVEIAYRDTIAAVLLSLVDDQASVATPRGAADRTNGFGSQASDPPRSSYRSDDVPPPVVRAWAHRKGISIGDRGRIPMWVVNQYHAEHAEEPQSALGLGPSKEEDAPVYNRDGNADTSESKLQDFFQILRGEPHDG